MPLIIWVPVRIVRAFVETALLVLDTAVVRRLPWAYIARLPRRNLSIAFTTSCLVASALGLAVGVLVPSVLRVALLIAIASLGASIVRTWGHRSKMPR